MYHHTYCKHSVLEWMTIVIHYSLLLLGVLLIYSQHSDSMEVIMERPNLTYTSDKYLANASATVTRFGRHSPYYLNIYGAIKQPWGNNVTVDFIFYEYLSNEYRRSFVEFHAKLCDLLEKEPYIGHNLMVAVGASCPFPQGQYKLENITVNAKHFPHVWPFEKGLVNVRAYQTGTNDTILNGFLYLTFKQPKTLPKQKQHLLSRND